MDIFRLLLKKIHDILYRIGEISFLFFFFKLEDATASEIFSNSPLKNLRFRWKKTSVIQKQK